MRPDVIFKSTVLLIALLVLPFTIMAQTLGEAQVAYNAGITANGEGNIEEAISQFTTCIEACEYLVDEEEDETAEELMYTVQAVVPKLYYQLGTDQLKNQEIEKGLANIYKAKEVAENYGDQETIDKTKKTIPQIHYKIAASKYKAGEMENAITELDKAIAANANYGSAYYLKAVVYKKQKNDDAVSETAKLGIEAAKRANDSKTEKKIVDLGKKHFLKKGNESKGASKYDEAVNYLNKSLEFDDSDPTTLYLLAQTYNAQKKYAQAIEAGLKATESETRGDEAKAKIYMVIAEAQTAKGDTSSACATYKKAAVGQYAELANYRIQHELKCQ